MNPVALGILTLKVAFCTLFLVVGIRLMLLSQESLLSFVSRLLGIADLEISPAMLKIVKVVGLILAIISIVLAYFFFGPDTPTSSGARS